MPTGGEPEASVATEIEGFNGLDVAQEKVKWKHKNRFTPFLLSLTSITG